MPHLKTITETFMPVSLSRLVPLLTDFQKMCLKDKQEVIDELVASHALLSLDFQKGWRFRRARKIDNISVDHVDDLLWPPNALASAGRANAKGQPVMYLADRWETALREIRQEAGEVVLAEFSIQPEKICRFLPIGEMLFCNRTGSGRLMREHGAQLNDFINACKTEEAQAYLITDSFLHEVLTDDEAPYDLSSYLCNAIFKKYSDITVIAYPSAQQIGALNFAVRTESFWSSWGVISVSKFYAEHLAQGFYSTKQHFNVSGIYSSGKLEWEGKQSDLRMTSLLNPVWTPLE
ncbi:RES domain-containing protein [Herbaspirillum seropedicae]|uniref:RES family NAD+ phosphorylase n=1 Tax=Herbaspirillum seropedicae TaxID=964 RepID=UPI001122E693|nr:RES family NAD+ phosphorylase [Herbaspirillum seropedicae]QDD66649.1 RES domain-containing protein [Herbaspirillum seropedicae]